MINKLKKGFVVVAMTGLVFTTNMPSVQVDAASKSCISSSCVTSKNSTTSTCKVGTTFTCGNLCYKVTGKNTVSCTGFKKNCNTTSCRIPNTVKYNGKTLKVTKIANNAFANCDNLKSVKVGNCVTTIGKNAFAGCDSLSKVNLGNCVNTVSNNVFSNCKKLKVVNCSKKIKNCGTNSFGKAVCKVN